MRQKLKSLLVQCCIYAVVGVEEGSPCQEDPKFSANVSYTVRLSQRNKAKNSKGKWTGFFRPEAFSFPLEERLESHRAGAFERETSRTHVLLRFILVIYTTKGLQGAHEGLKFVQLGQRDSVACGRRNSSRKESHWITLSYKTRLISYHILFKVLIQRT